MRTRRVQLRVGTALRVVCCESRFVVAGTEVRQYTEYKT